MQGWAWLIVMRITYLSVEKRNRMLSPVAVQASSSDSPRFGSSPEMAEPWFAHEVGHAFTGHWYRSSTAESNESPCSRSSFPLEANKSYVATYDLCKRWILGWSLRASDANGLVPTHDLANVVSKFKTEQPVRCGPYATRIVSLTDK